MDETIEQNVYEEELVKDNKAIESYLRNIYSESAPRPTPPTEDDLSFWKIAGLESSLFVLSGIGAAVLSAIRTGGLFWLLEELLFNKFGVLKSLGGLFGFISMISALLAFEGFLLGYGLSRGRKSGKMEVSQTGLIVSMVTVISAGIFSSFSIVTVTENWQAIMNVALALITGGASALVAFYSSENLGYILNHVSAKKTEILSNHQANYTHWREGGLKAYFKSHYNIRHKNSDKVYGGNQQQNAPIIASPVSTAPMKKKSKVELGFDFVSRYYLENGTLPTNKVVSDGAGVAIGSAFTAIQNFIVLNEGELLSKKVISQEQVERANSVLNDAKKQSSHEIDDSQKLMSYITQSGMFPSSEIVSQMNVSESNLAKFIVENESFIRDKNLLTDEIIEEAIDRYKE